MAASKMSYAHFINKDNLTMLNKLRAYEKQYGTVAYNRLIENLTPARNTRRLDVSIDKLKSVSI